VAGLALMSTQAGVDSDEVLASYRAMMETWTQMGALEPLVAAIATIILGAPEHWLPWTDHWKAMPREHLREPAICLLTRDDITSRLGEIDAPAIVFHGTADTAIGMARAEVLAAGLKGCRGLVKVDGGAHAANVTHAAQVNGPLREFLRSVAV
jgi:pimeloyl-ACP methyl ester carboxylesterase